jgi:hypothetical protein
MDHGDPENLPRSHRSNAFVNRSSATTPGSFTERLRLRLHQLRLDNRVLPAISSRVFMTNGRILRVHLEVGSAGKRASLGVHNLVPAPTVQRHAPL